MKRIFRKTKYFLTMIKFSHTLFALPFALVAFLLIYAEQTLSENMYLTWQNLFWIILAFTGMRSFSMAVNRIVDAKFDAANPRTAIREIPSGKLSATSVMIFGIISFLVVCFSAWMLAKIAFYLAFPAAILLAGYSYSKRFTFLCHYWLGAVIGMAPLGVYIAITQTLPPQAWILFLILFSYIAGFDILYSIQDYEFDKEQKLHSLPADWGVQPSLIISLFTHFVTILSLFILYKITFLNIIFLIGNFILTILILAEHYVVGWGKNVKIEKIPVAFFNYNSAFSLFFLLIVFLDIIF